MKRLHVALIYNGYREEGPEAPEDRASTADLLQMIRMMARTMRRLGHTVTILPLVNDIFSFQRKLRRLNPDVVFNQYEYFVHGGIYDTLVVALVRMMGYPLTGAPALARLARLADKHDALQSLTVDLAPLGCPRPDVLPIHPVLDLSFRDPRERRCLAHRQGQILPDAAAVRRVEFKGTLRHARTCTFTRDIRGAGCVRAG